MPKPFHQFARRTLYRKSGNLTSFDDPFEQMPRLLSGAAVRTIVDAGASDGRVTRRLLERFPQATAYAFEPQPRYAPALEAFAAAEPRFRPQRLALGAQPGSIDLNLTRSPGQTSVFSPNRELNRFDEDGSRVAEVVSVPVVRLDDWAQQQGLESVDLIKLDIQQAEVLALSGATRLLGAGVRLVYTEVFFNPLYEGGALFGEIDALLRPLGFVLHGLYEPRHDPETGRLLWANAIFLRG